MDDKVVDLAGNPINQDNPKENDYIRETLEQYLEMNRNGDILSIAVCVTDISDRAITWDYGLPGSSKAQLLGAIEIMKDDILESVRGIYKDIDEDICD